MLARFARNVDQTFSVIFKHCALFLSTIIAKSSFSITMLTKMKTMPISLLEKLLFFLVTHGGWKSKKKSHLTLRATELRLHSEWTKVHSKCQKIINLGEFLKLEACGQTVLPDRWILIRQKLVKNTKMSKNQMRHF